MLLVIAAGALLAVGAAGCGSNGTSPASSTTGSATTSTRTSTAASGKVESTSSPVPSTLPDAQFDHGQTIYMSSQGLLPKVLVSDLGKPVVWRNDTGQSLQLVFDNLEIATATIPAGSSFVYTPPTAISMTYHVTTSPALHGAVEVTPVGGTP